MAVILRGFRAVGARELGEWINARVAAKFQRVTDVMIMDDFPRNVGGKTLKCLLGEQYKRSEAVWIRLHHSPIAPGGLWLYFGSAR